MTIENETNANKQPTAAEVAEAAEAFREQLAEAFTAAFPDDSESVVDMVHRGGNLFMFNWTFRTPDGVHAFSRITRDMAQNLAFDLADQSKYFEFTKNSMIRARQRELAALTGQHAEADPDPPAEE